MPPITVDPEALSSAGESIGSVGDEIAAAVDTLASSLSGGARSGTDPAGLVFGHSYQQLAQGLLDAGEAAVNAGRSVGFGVQMSATNYSRADAASTIGGGAAALTQPDAPGEFSGPAAPSAQGGGVPPPLLWSVIQSFIPDVWPDGDPASLRAAGNAWQSFATTISGIAGHLAGPSGVVAGQQIPEGDAITSAISKLTQSLTGIASEAGKLATQTQEFADDVENTQNAIRDLLDRVSPSGLLDGFMSVINGDALEELKEVAEDVKTILGDYGRQAEARRDMLQIAMGAIDDAIVSVEQWARREFPKYLGDDVGNALATALDFELTLGQGILAGGVDLADGIGQFDPLRFAYDPDGAKEAWAGMAESLGEGLLYATPTGVLSNPIGAFNHYKDQVTDAVHAEDWSSDRPGYGLGKILFDVGASVVPGGAAARGTKAAADAAADAVPSPGRLPDTPGGLGSFTSASQRVDDIEVNLSEVGDNIPTTPMAAGPNGPAVPEALADPPSAPPAPDATGTPRVSDPPGPNPPGPPTPHAADSTPAPHVPGSSTPDVPGSSSPHVPDSTPVDRTPVSPSNTTPAATPHTPDAPQVDRAPVSPHSPTPASPAAAAPTADLPAGSQHTSPTPTPTSTASVSTAPPAAATHGQESPPPVSMNSADEGTGHTTDSASVRPDGNHSAESESRVHDDAPGATHEGSGPQETSGGSHDDGGSDDGSAHDSPVDEGERNGPGHESSHHSYAPALDENGHYVPGTLPSYQELRDLTTTEPNSAHYWSGRDANGVGVGPDGSGIAERIADGSNGTTLEMTLERHGINPLPAWNRHDPESVRFWEEASAAYAENASGEVTATIGSNLRPGNIWQSVEIPRLMENPDVTRIVQIDPDTGRSTVIFSRKD